MAPKTAAPQTAAPLTNAWPLTVLVRFIHRGCDDPRCLTSDAVDFSSYLRGVDRSSSTIIHTITEAVKDHVITIHGEHNNPIELCSVYFQWDGKSCGSNMLEMKKEDVRRKQLQLAISRRQVDCLHVEFDSTRNPGKEGSKNSLPKQTEVDIEADKVNW